MGVRCGYVLDVGFNGLTMIEYLSSLYWDDIRYMVSVPLCIIVGYLIGWNRHKEECAKEKRREAILTAIKPSGVYLEDGWEEG